MSEARGKIIEILEKGESNEIPLTFKRYEEALAMAQDEEDFDLFRVQKLSDYLGGLGSSNIDWVNDVLNILKELNHPDGADIEDIANKLELPKKYIYFICYILDKNYLAQPCGSGWVRYYIDDDGADVLNPSCTALYRERMKDMNMEE